jgi:hypothetical protein
MNSNTMTMAPCLITQDGTPGDQCKGLDTVLEGMLTTSLLRIRLCETLLDQYGYQYGVATISGPAQQVYLPGKLIRIITPHWSKSGRIATWLPQFSVDMGDSGPVARYDFTMTVKILRDK